MKRFANQFLAGGFLLFTLPLLRGAPNQFSIQIVKDGSAVPQMSWGVQSNLLFFLEARTDFATASWGRMAVSNLQASLTNSIAWVKDVRPPGNRQFYRLRAAPISRFGAHASLGKRPDFPNYLGDLGASWARVNANLDGNDGDFRPFLDAGLNLIITFSNRDPLNVNTNYGGLAEWPKAGFPFLSKSNYEQRTREALGPLLPYLAMGQQVWVQCENEIGDAASGAGSIYWRGTTDQYLTNNLQTLSDVARSLSPAIRVVLTSFASENLDTVLTPADPNYIFQTNRMTRLLSEGLYDAADLHFYGAVSNIPPKIQWVKDRLPPGRLWITTENGGPDSRVPPYLSYLNTNQFQSAQALQVVARFDAASTNGAAVVLWFSLADLQGEVDAFSHLGLLEPGSGTNMTKKPAYDAFKNYTATNRF